MVLRAQLRRTFDTALFDGGALGYAVLTRAPAWRSHCGALVDRANLRAGHRVLDLGCGPGISAFAMLDREPGLDVVGLDVSRAMLFFGEFWRRREPRGDRVRFVRADATRLPFADRSFDVVTGHSFLYLVPEPGRVLAEVCRVLRPGGRCVFLEPNRDAPETLIPRAILSHAPSDPRFVLAMALWRTVSRTRGRFDADRFETLFGHAGLSFVACEPTLAGLGLYGLGERPPEPSANEPHHGTRTPP